MVEFFLQDRGIHLFTRIYSQISRQLKSPTLEDKRQKIYDLLPWKPTLTETKVYGVSSPTSDPDTQTEIPQTNFRFV